MGHANVSMGLLLFIDVVVVVVVLVFAACGVLFLKNVLSQNARHMISNYGNHRKKKVFSIFVFRPFHVLINLHLFVCT